MKTTAIKAISHKSSTVKDGQNLKESKVINWKFINDNAAKV